MDAPDVDLLVVRGQPVAAQDTWYAAAGVEADLLAVDPDGLDGGPATIVPWEMLPVGAGPRDAVRARAAADLDGSALRYVKLGWSGPGGQWLRLSATPN